MEIFSNPQRSQWAELCLRPSSDNPVVRQRVEAIIERVRQGGDDAIRQITLEVEGRSLNSLQISREEIEQAATLVAPEVREAIICAEANIRKFHEAQKQEEIVVETAPGVVCSQKSVPIRKVGLYVPGGTAPLFSTVLMLAVPARIAGCSEIVLCTPAGPSGKVAPEVLFAASVAGVSSIFAIGGAQAIAAMAYGTESVPAVHKIFGPGNQYVTTAKQILGGRKVAIDMPAGPSEVMVIADESAQPSYVAADLLSQAEHGRDSQVMLVCSDENFARKVMVEVKSQCEVLGRRELAESALSQSRAIVLSSTRDIVDFAEEYAPEHLIIQTVNSGEIAEQITAAGSVFLGAYTPESAGDYASGTNHTLPTCAWAKSYSGVNLGSFSRRMTLQQISAEGLRKLGPTIVAMAEAEGLQAHANAVKIRLDNE